MANHPLWTEELWPLIIQLYQQKPVGVKPMYARQTVDLAMELHIPPQVIYQKMFSLRQQLPPSLQRLRDTICASPRKLRKACDNVRQMAGYGTAGSFFTDVETCETFERDFRPIVTDDGPTPYTPIMLIIILDLYFQLIPATMVVETPDVQEVAALLGIKAQEVVDILEIYTYCDPYIEHQDSLFDPMLPDCHRIWQRFANDDPMLLTNTATQMKAYFK